jgi:hypothetical protein
VLEVSTLSSPAAKPGAINVPGLALGLGDGVGLPDPVGDAAATGIRLAPVSNENVPDDSVMIVGDKL